VLVRENLRNGTWDENPSREDGLLVRQTNRSVAKAGKSHEVPARVEDHRNSGDLITSLAGLERLTSERSLPINWPQMKEHQKWQELDILASDRLEVLAGGLARRAAAISKLVYEACWKCFKPVTVASPRTEQQPN